MSAPSYDTIKYEVDGHKATITLNRPDALNALSPHMVTELRNAYHEAENDDAVWLLIVTGTGRAFCTGADVKAIPGDGKVINERPYLSSYEQWEAPQEGTPPFRTMAKPVLAAINGLCCGAGLDWVTTGDIVIASDKATFFDPHVSIGLVAARELVRVARVLPRSIALRMALMGKHERLSAQRAYELGMISEIVDHDRLLERAHEIADIVNSNAPLAVRGTRLAILKGLDLPLHEAEMLAESFRERNLHTEDSLSRAPRRSSKSGHRNGGVDDFPDHRTRGGQRGPDCHHHIEPPRSTQRVQPNDVRGDGAGVATRQGGRLRQCDRSASRGQSGVQRGPRRQDAIRSARKHLESRRSRRGAQSEVAEDVEAGGVRRARHVHSGRVLLHQRVRCRHLLHRRHVLRFPCIGRAGVRSSRSG